ncbi:host attachment protein [Methylicorpusculum sp.]|uniref:host attachment protein n=1 Tax=Methylicorpusculum sp. TaxID=2713644 RepID=UPI00271D7FBB|nr:host attachment protein [Methylicorpusculum sp.]MDO8842933.1 host attachment protein [Methylicorpusculum sp.]MDP2179694.1 host attachment protein [Methylicorpusculum sp.]MDP3530915.1 host attachment protein [Methylicorpusculum sp.]MDZ4150545.1 host attachment protein [Methylicorpusculum sp.]
MLVTWVVVADSSRARFFSSTSLTEPMQEFDGMVHVEGRMRELNELSDRQGGIAGGHGEGDHTFEAPTDFKHHEAVVFAKQIGVKLDQGRVNNEYGKLILVAPPAFLGVLRESLNSHVSDLVAQSLNKNLVVEDESVIREHIHHH